jgi:SAM-dependent methyltransferase
MYHEKEYNSAEHALRYLAGADQIPHRAAGEATLLEFVPTSARRILDLGAGDGRLLALLRIDRPAAAGVATDLSPTMLEAARARFAADPLVDVVEHDLDRPLPDLGTFDAVVSSFAIHHCSHDRKRALYAEVFDVLEPGGVFYNLEHVASATPELHQQFLDALGITAEQEDQSNQLLDVETQVAWLRAIGFEQVDCHWKWRELALFGGVRPSK